MGLVLAAQARPLDDGYREGSQLDADIFGSLWTAAHVSFYFATFCTHRGSIAACGVNYKLLLELRLNCDLLITKKLLPFSIALHQLHLQQLVPAVCFRADCGYMLAQSRRNLAASPRALHDGVKAIEEPDAVAVDCAADETAAVSTCVLHACLGSFCCVHWIGIVKRAIELAWLGSSRKFICV